MSFTDKDKELINMLMNQVAEQKYVASKPKQIRDIVPIERWLNDEYYIGADGAKLYPHWKKVMTELFQPSTEYTELILGGSIGTGKSTCALYCLVRKLYEMSCYENIAGFYGLMKTSKIAFIYFSLNLMQANATGFGQLRNIIDSIPYFQEYFQRNLKKDSILEFPENVFFKAGSTNNHAIGLNLIGSILDEANFHQGETSEANAVSDVSQVESLYDSIQARARSRFIYGGKNHSLSILVSSSTHKGSMTEKRIKVAEQENFAHTYVAQPKLWDVKGDRYSKDRFLVFTGSDKLDPLIIETMADFKTVADSLFIDIKGMSMKDAGEMFLELPDDLVVAVPTDFIKDFTTNINKAIQDIAGVSTRPTGRLFSSEPTYNKCVGTKLHHPFGKEQLIISTGDKVRMEDYLLPNYTFADPHKPHYIHIDASTTGDSTGFSMVHLDSMVQDDTGAESPLFIVDLQVKINPPKPPHKIALAKIRQFVVYLRDFLGINILGVSYDQAHSSESRQILEGEGFNVEYRSVDRTDEAYLNFCSLIYERRIIDYKYLPFEDEFFNLIHYRSKRKVDHLPAFSKDICDAKVGAVQGLIDNLMTAVSMLSNGDFTISSDHEEDSEEIFTINDFIDYDDDEDDYDDDFYD